MEADFNGNVKRRIALPETPPTKPASNYSTTDFNPIFESERGLFIPDIPFVLNESLLEYSNWIVDFSLQDSSSSHVSFSFPSSAGNFLDDAEFSNSYEELHRGKENGRHFIPILKAENTLPYKKTIIRA